ILLHSYDNCIFYAIRLALNLIRNAEQKLSKLGFVGTGSITVAIVEGLHAGEAPAPAILVSPRNAQNAKRLAAAFKGVSVAHDNQQIVDESDITLLAVRPQVAEEVVRALRFRNGQKLVSLVAGIGADTLQTWISEKVDIVQAIPLPFVAARLGFTVICPPDNAAIALFDRVGSTLGIEDQRSLKVFFAASAMMGLYFGLLETASDWLLKEGLEGSAAKHYLNSLFAGLSHAALNSGADFPDLRHEFSTKGGINEQLFRVFSEHGGRSALHEGLDAVMARLNKA
ncbi:pyrroline-5-carboxylate reductase, partial [Mesorhizobium sp. M7D.F.Ca.US.004.01.2.1]|uniref:pyrroline-5-carboxylate reductase n=1 Tax=Mesorhizobium sp. M7D.F.Ca.US.004.01.2.1 TaxID=2496738 RepID=UPI0032B00255